MYYRLCLTVKVIEDFVSTFEEKEVSLRADIIGDITLRCDPRRLAQALSNLLQNALKFTPPGGEVVLRVRVDELEATFSVIDNGIAIQPDEVDKVFEREWQSVETAHLGSGMGLCHYQLCQLPGLSALRCGWRARDWRHPRRDTISCHEKFRVCRRSLHGTPLPSLDRRCRGHA
jgi:hypothetical protein